MAIADSPESRVGDVESQPRKAEQATRAKRRFRWLRWVALALVLAGGSGALWAKIAFDRIEADAQRVAEIGTALNKFLKEYVTALQTRDTDGLLALHAPDYASRQEGLWDWQLRSERDGVRVLDWRLEDARPYSHDDLREQTEHLLARAESLDSAKFKISSLEQCDDKSAVIRAVLWLRGAGMDHAKLESRAEFRIGLRHESSKNWQITSKELLYGQTVLGEGTGFTNITQQAGITFEARHNPMLLEPEWYPERFGIMKYAAAGVSTADYDNDGWVDIFFSDGTSPALFRNCGNGQFEDVTAAAGLPVGLNAVHVALFADLDNDNDRDLFLGRSTGQNYLFANDGDGTFTDVTDSANVSGIWVSTASAADYNNDGLIDLYLGRYLDPRVDLPTTNFYTRNGQGNALLRNEGKLTFTDVTEEAGVREGGLTLGIAWGDYDKDGDQDVYVANDFGRNALLRNNADGTFTDVSRESGTVDIGYGMSSCFEDVDNDGDLDIYVAAVHSGQRWFGNSATLQRYLLTSIQEGTILEDYPLYSEILSLLDGNWQDFGEAVIRGNSLMLNNGDGTFTDVTEQSRVNPHGWYWSSMICDFDNDCRQDIYTVNGWITGREKDDL